MTMLRAALAAPLVMLLLACSPALNWREVALQRSSAHALLPCKPERATRSVPLGGVATELAVVGCDAAGATFAVMTASAPAGASPDAVLAGWQQATLANMQADAAQVQRSDFRPTGGLPLAHAQRIVAQGRRADGRAVAAQAVWSAHPAPEGGGIELLHAVVYAERADPVAADAFFAGLGW
ncbi:MAG: hypothetical protein J0I00_15350 [Burkholderiales bacterium]|uniref:Uncharacterized protein n=1 Tax=Ottowia pentelensis TaxID=511108 RepID=A0ABV6PNI3_9BURK|nr:hypothetical protein [Burkholderiales bacterium]MBS0403259.1 hypothetical protein [Pseudomonadota bacterium]